MIELPAVERQFTLLSEPADAPTIWNVHEPGEHGTLFSAPDADPAVLATTLELAHSVPRTSREPMKPLGYGAHSTVLRIGEIAFKKAHSYEIRRQTNPSWDADTHELALGLSAVRVAVALHKGLLLAESNNNSDVSYAAPPLWACFLARRFDREGRGTSTTWAMGYMKGSEPRRRHRGMPADIVRQEQYYQALAMCGLEPRQVHLDDKKENTLVRTRWGRVRQVIKLDSQANLCWPDGEKLMGRD